MIQNILGLLLHDSKYLRIVRKSSLFSTNSVILANEIEEINKRILESSDV